MQYIASYNMNNHAFEIEKRRKIEAFYFNKCWPKWEGEGFMRHGLQPLMIPPWGKQTEGFVKF